MSSAAYCRRFNQETKLLALNRGVCKLTASKSGLMTDLLTCGVPETPGGFFHRETSSPELDRCRQERPVFMEMTKYCDLG